MSTGTNWPPCSTFLAPRVIPQSPCFTCKRHHTLLLLVTHNVLMRDRTEIIFSAPYYFWFFSVTIIVGVCVFFTIFFLFLILIWFNWCFSFNSYSHQQSNLHNFHKLLRQIKLTANWLPLDFVSNYVTCKVWEELDVFHDTKCPHWDQEVNNIKLNSAMQSNK